MGEDSHIGKHRILLAVSIALFAHTLIGIFLGNYQWLADAPKTVTFQLVISGKPEANSQTQTSTTPSNPSSEQLPSSDEAAASTPQSQQHMQQPPTEQPTEQAQDRQQVTPRVSTTAPQPVQSPQAASAASKEQKPKTGQAPQTRPIEGESAISSALAASPFRSSSNKGDVSPFTDRGATEGTNRLTSKPSELLSAYQSTLREHLAERINRSTIKKDMNKAYEITIELRLMSNGALRKVDVIQSSGDLSLDNLVVRTALAASPYPAPPAEASENGFRFPIPLIISPELI